MMKRLFYLTVLIFQINSLHGQDYKVDIKVSKEPPVRDYTKVDSVTVINKGSFDLYVSLAFSGDTNGVQLLSTGKKKIGVNKSENFYIRILSDLNIQTDKHYSLQLTAAKTEQGQPDFEKYQGFTVKVPLKKDSSELFTPNPLKKVDFLLFIGANYDPNRNAKISGSSFEAVVPFTYSEKKNFRSRIGVYTHPNFSRDSANARSTQHYRLDDNELVSGQSMIGQQVSDIVILNNTRSYGGYFDLIYAINKPEMEKGVNVSLYFHAEYARRIVSQELRSSIYFQDSTLLYTDAMRQQVESGQLVIHPFKRDEKLRGSERITNQFYFFVGPLIELSYNNLELFFQTYAGVNLFNNTPVTGGSLPGGRSLTTGFKIQAKIFNSIAATIDIKEPEGPTPYINISFGVPISVLDMAKKLK